MVLLKLHSRSRNKTVYNKETGSSVTKKVGRNWITLCNAKGMVVLTTEMYKTKQARDKALAFIKQALGVMYKVIDTDAKAAVSSKKKTANV